MRQVSIYLPVPLTIVAMEFAMQKPATNLHYGKKQL